MSSPKNNILFSEHVLGSDISLYSETISHLISLAKIPPSKPFPKEQLQKFLYKDHTKVSVCIVLSYIIKSTKNIYFQYTKKFSPNKVEAIPSLKDALLFLYKLYLLSLCSNRSGEKIEFEIFFKKEIFENLKRLLNVVLNNESKINDIKTDYFVDCLNLLLFLVLKFDFYLLFLWKSNLQVLIEKTKEFGTIQKIRREIRLTRRKIKKGEENKENFEKEEKVAEQAEKDLEELKNVLGGFKECFEEFSYFFGSRAVLVREVILLGECRAGEKERRLVRLMEKFGNKNEKSFLEAVEFSKLDIEIESTYFLASQNLNSEIFLSRKNYFFGEKQLDAVLALNDSEFSFCLLNCYFGFPVVLDSGTFDCPKKHLETLNNHIENHNLIKTPLFKLLNILLDFNLPNEFQFFVKSENGFLPISFKITYSLLYPIIKPTIVFMANEEVPKSFWKQDSERWKKDLNLVVHNCDKEASRLLGIIFEIERSIYIKLKDLKECSICYLIFMSGESCSEKCRSCRTVFHKECIEKWFGSHAQDKKCPFCRGEFY